MNTEIVERRPGWWYPYIYAGVFVVVLAVNLVFMASAVRTFTGIETEHAYDKGLAYNDVLAQAQAQAKLGWTVEAVVLPHDEPGAKTHDADLVVSYLDKAGKPVSGLSVKGQFVRPTKAGFDTPVDLVEQGGGRYVGLVKLPLPGQWEVQVAATKGEIAYQLGQRVLVP